MSRFIVTGTDTGLGKTVFAAALAGATGAAYWKPVQAGLDGETDSQTVARLSGARVLPEAYRFKLPASPHKAAAEEGVSIAMAKLALPDAPKLVVEGAGGLMVPLTPDTLLLTLFQHWHVPLVLCARTTLGTINHTLLSLEAIRIRNMSLLGVAFIGEANDDSEAIICKLGQAKRLGRLPLLPALTRENLAAAFAENFDLADFA